MSKVLISGGGTGGHIFPAIAIAQALRTIDPGIEILFVGAKGRLEMEKVPQAGFRIAALPIAGFHRRFTRKNLLFPVKLMVSLLRSRKIIRSFQPDIVVGVGGYASGPTLRMANRLRIPTLIQEQNSYPGVTNRLLGKKAKTICVAYEGMEAFFRKEKLVLTGNPVRKNLTDYVNRRPDGLQHFGLQEDHKIVLILGGSGGAKSINQAVFTCLIRGIEQQGIRLIWQTGRFYYDRVRFQLAEHGFFFREESPVPNTARARGVILDSVIKPFIDRIDFAYACADVVVTRSGAIAISELSVVGKPAILIPSPNVAGDHQTRNAMALVRKKAAILIPDHEANEKLFPTLIGLLQNESLQQELKTQISSLAMPNAAEQIASEIIALINSTKTR